MQLIIAGSPTFTDSQHLCQVLAPDRHRLTQVLTGRARGAEQLGYRWAWKHLVKHQLVRAEWARFGGARSRSSGSNGASAKSKPRRRHCGGTVWHFSTRLAQTPL